MTALSARLHTADVAAKQLAAQPARELKVQKQGEACLARRSISIKICTAHTRTWQVNQYSSLTILKLAAPITAQASLLLLASFSLQAPTHQSVNTRQRLRKLIWL